MMGSEFVVARTLFITPINHFLTHTNDSPARSGMLVYVKVCPS